MNAYNDFDFLQGKWRVLNTRLVNWLSNCHDWMEFESFHVEQKRNKGLGNIAIHQYVLDRNFFERSIMRSYNPQFDFWKIDRMDGTMNLLMSPLQGTFWRNKGSFLSKGIFNTVEVLIWVEWTKITNTYVTWEQAFSTDNGRTWETNWVMDFFKS